MLRILRESGRQTSRSQRTIANTPCRQTLSKMEARGKGEHNELMAKIVEHRAGLNQIQRDIQKVKDEVTQAQKTSNSNASIQSEMATELRDEVKALSNSTACNMTRLDSISSTTSSIHSSVMSLRNLGEQVTRFIGTFPAEIRDLLQRILRTNLQIYYMLLQSQNMIPASPSRLVQSTIKFEDALGRVRELPYEWFRHWEV